MFFVFFYPPLAAEEREDLVYFNQAGLLQNENKSGERGLHIITGISLN